MNVAKSEFTSTCTFRLTVSSSVFELSHDDVVPELLKICVVLFSMPEADFKKHEKSRKVPKASAFSPENAELLTKVINERIAQYGSVLEVGVFVYRYLILTTPKDDISRLNKRDSLSRNHFNALVVTVGERRILKKALDQLQHTDHASKKQRVE